MEQYAATSGFTADKASRLRGDLTAMMIASAASKLPCKHVLTTKYIIVSIGVDAFGQRTLVLASNSGESVQA